MKPIIWVARLRLRDYEIRNPDGSVRATVKVLSIPIDWLKLNAELENKGFKEGDELRFMLLKKGARDPYDVIMEALGVT